jgi:outer membrane lipoprotein carrier protein
LSGCVARFTAVVLLGALLVAPAARAADPQPPAGDAATRCAEEVASRVQQHYDGVRDLSADFEQTSRVASLGDDTAAEMRASGEVVFAKPGRMRWSYLEPEKSLVVTDGRELWTFDPGLGEAQRLPVQEGFLSGAAMQFLLGEGEVLQQFRVKAKSCDAGRAVLDLEPREPAAYERLVLEVDAKSGRVDASEVTDLFGNVTRVAFRKVRTNTGPDDYVFEFKPPKGTRVIEIPSGR